MKDKLTVELFRTEVRDNFEAYLRLIAEAFRRGTSFLNQPYSFPSSLRIAESPTHYIAEFQGARSVLFPKSYKIEVPKSVEQPLSTTAYLNPGLKFPHSPSAAIVFVSEDNVWRGGTICTRYDLEEFKKKVDFLLDGTRVQFSSADLPIKVEPSADKLLFEDVNLIRMDGAKVLFRYISTAIVIRKGTTRTQFRRWLLWLFSHVDNPAFNRRTYGLNIGYDASTALFSKELASLADQNVSERIIDSFIQSHVKQFSTALGYEDAIPQAELRWVDGPPEDVGRVSKPDYLMKRRDGCFDILDLKKAALKYTSIVKGGKQNRHRFVDYANELVAQLAGYERYFAYEANRQWALDRYGVKVNSPRLVGVVGNYDSFTRHDVDLALGPYGDNIVLYSYQDVINLLRGKHLLMSS